VVDGVFEPVAGEEGVCDGVIFHPATGVYADTVAQVQASLRLPLLRAFVGRGLLEGFEAKEMLAYRHSGFSVDTSVCIAAHDRAGLERLLRYCARPPFALARLRKAGSELGNSTAPVIRPARYHWRKRRQDKGPRADGPCNCSRTRAGAAQASGPLPLGAQTADFNGDRSPKNPAILGIISLNFLSASLEIALPHG